MRIGFIGAGNMAEALMQGIMGGGMPQEMFLALDVSRGRCEAMRSLGYRMAENMDHLVAESDLIVLSVKPVAVRQVLNALGTYTSLPDVLSIVVSLSLHELETALPNARGVARAMPNTPARVGEGVIALCENHTMGSERFERVLAAFSHCGRTMVVPERLMGAVTAISGSGPAYVYLFIEALADAGVREGLPRSLAYDLAAQTTLGASKMVLDTGIHPAALKDAVCSPGGTTIEAIYALENAGMRAAVTDAVNACARKAASMGRVKEHS